MVAGGPAGEVITPAMLREAYGVEARVERCSRGRPALIVDSISAGREQQRLTPP
jgi:iron complex transport system ATP-binding protein